MKPVVRWIVLCSLSVAFTLALFGIARYRIYRLSEMQQYADLADRLRFSRQLDSKVFNESTTSVVMLPEFSGSMLWLEARYRAKAAGPWWVPAFGGHHGMSVVPVPLLLMLGYLLTHSRRA